MDMLKKYIGVLSIYFIVFSQMLDTSVANLSLMKIAPDLGIDVLHASWIMTSFGTGLIISFPIASILSKKYQPDAVFFYCSLGFILTSIGCGFGVGSLDFVFMRFVQGMTSGIVIILSQALMIRIMGEENKAFAMSLWVSAISLAPIFGPMLGAYITDQLGWRWIFFINVPIVGLCLIGLGNQVARVTDVKKDDKRVYASLFLFAISICCMQYVLDFGRQLGWLQSSAIITAIALAVLSFAVFLMVNSLRNYQIFDLSLFSNYNFTISAIIISIGNGLIFSSLIILPIWLQSDYKIPIITAGVVVSVGSLVAAIISPMIGKYVKPSQYLSFSVLSLFCLGASFLMASQFALDTSMRYILLSRVFFGLGVASFTVPLTALSLSTLDNSQYISANSIIMTTRVLCANIATSLAFVYFTHRYYIEYELILSNIDRFSVTQDQSVEAMYPLVVSLARTETFQLEFLLHAVAFFVMGVTIYAINVISRKPAQEEGVVESA